jgi:hypothetical protein
MNKPAEAIPMTERTAESEHIRTHRRWARAVLALYGIVVSIGIIATLVHGSMIADSRLPPMQLQAKAQIQ